MFLFQVWESVDDLQLLPVFSGLKQSVAEHSDQWREYFNVRCLIVQFALMVSLMCIFTWDYRIPVAVETYSKNLLKLD